MVTIFWHWLSIGCWGIWVRLACDHFLDYTLIQLLYSTRILDLYTAWGGCNQESDYELRHTHLMMNLIIIGPKLKLKSDYKTRMATNIPEVCQFAFSHLDQLKEAREESTCKYIEVIELVVHNWEGGSSKRRKKGRINYN